MQGFNHAVVGEIASSVTRHFHAGLITFNPFRVGRVLHQFNHLYVHVESLQDTFHFEDFPHAKKNLVFLARVVNFK